MGQPRRPDPEPLEVDDVRIITAGTVLWALAFVVLLAAHRRLADHHASWWLWACAAGFGLGLAGVRYCRRRRAARARSGGSAPGLDAPPA